MSFLSSVSTEPKVQGSIITIHGPNGVGKTSFLARATLARPVNIDLEDGSNYLKVPRINNVKSWTDLKAVQKELLAPSHGYTLVGFDTIDIVEHFIAQHICEKNKVDSIEKAEGGFGKGYVLARTMLREFMDTNRVMANAGVDVVIMAHSQVKAHNDPITAMPYDRHILRIQDKNAAIVKDLSDVVAFATYKIYVAEQDNGKAKAIGGEERVLYTQYSAAFDAKNRLNLPVELPLSYDSFKTAALSQYAPKVEDIQATIKAMITTMDDRTMAEKVAKSANDAGSDIKKLVAIKARLETLINK